MDFLTSLGTIFLCALLLGSICKKLKLPPLLGMLVIGIILGPYVLDVISPSLLKISQDLRQLALVIILTRAGLSLDLEELKKNGRSAVLMCFVPATFEIAGYIAAGTLLLGLSVLDAAILGTVMAAVSPAVVVSRMIKLTEQGYGTDKGIPQLVTTGASVDDVYVIVLFAVLTGIATGGTFSWSIVWQVPVSIFLGVAVGILFGFVLNKIFQRFLISVSLKVVLLLSFSFLFIALENLTKEFVPYAAFLSVISMGAAMFRKDEKAAKTLSAEYSKLWIAAEILLFVLVGSAVNIEYAFASSGILVVVIVLTMIFRMAGVFACMIRSNLIWKERLFCAIAYTPKATVQAAIGAIPLTLGMASGSIILTTAVIGIIFTAPLGAFATDTLYKKLLNKEKVSV